MIFKFIKIDVCILKYINLGKLKFILLYFIIYLDKMILY